jgi:hypothetical protein
VGGYGLRTAAVVFSAFIVYSYRNASIGSSRDAL